MLDEHNLQNTKQKITVGAASENWNNTKSVWDYKTCKVMNDPHSLDICSTHWPHWKLNLVIEQS